MSEQAANRWNLRRQRVMVEAIPLLPAMAGKRPNHLMMKDVSGVANWFH
jgi:hypothetical protein